MPPIDPVVKKVGALPADEKLMMLLLSVLYVPTPVTRIVAALDELKGVQPRKIWTIHTAREALESLQKQCLVDIKGGQWFCRPETVEIATREAARVGFLNAMAVVVPRRTPVRKDDAIWSHRRRPEQVRASEEAMRDLRVATYLRDTSRFTLIIRNDWEPWLKWCDVHPFVQLCLSPFDEAWMDALPPTILDTFVNSLVDRGVAEQSFNDWLERRLIADATDTREEVRVRLAFRAVLEGRLDPAERLLAPLATAASNAMQGFLEMARGNAAASVKAYASGLELLRAATRRKKDVFHSDFGLLYVPALLACGRTDEAASLAALVADDKKHPCQDEYKVLQLAVALVRGQVVDDTRLPTRCADRGFGCLLSGALHAWRDPKAAPAPVVAAIEGAFTLAPKDGWLAAEMAEVLARLTGKKTWKDTAQALHARAGTKTFLDAIEVLPAWERTLTALEAFSAAPVAAEAAAPLATTRLVWHLDVREYEGRVSVSLNPREQKRTAKGWSGGRAVALKRLYDDWKKLEHLTDADRRICATIQAYRDNYYYSDVQYSFETAEALPHLVGHPLVFRTSDPDIRIDVVSARPVLRVEKQGSALALRLDPPMPTEGAFQLALKGKRVLEIVSFNETERRLGRLIGEGCTIPRKAEGRVSEVLAGLAKQVTVHADGVEASLETIEADPRLHVLLSPLGSGLRGQVVVRPLGDAGPEFSPGAGSATVMADVDGRPLQARRTLAAERTAWRTLQTSVGVDSVDDGWECDDPATALELLSSLAEQDVPLHWPQGAPWTIVRKLQWADLRLRMGNDREWFTVGGDVAVDEARVVTLASLLTQDRHGRFIRLGNGEFVALTQEMQRRLDDLAGLADVTAKGLRVHPLLAQQVDDALEGAAISGDKRWRAQLTRLRDVADIAIPSTLQAELRDYQADGVRWLGRLSQWGAGACLADDMGLGKTVQALALLLHRAPGGPALVVAPTSVCTNWVAEARRFAPTLQMRLHAGPTRELGRPGPFDVVVTSYALLTQDQASLTSIHWHTVVLDEAQAIKNASTQRSKAAMELRADFRMTATGTPIENHTGELWTLFGFLNPGLLGSRREFDTRFTAPIESGQREARQRLKRLVSPFILRRTKSQVLEELPTRTEITLHVELSEDERGLYEALRRKAVERLEGGDLDGKGRIAIFAELMRLRRACCHPRLVLDSADMTASKLETFSELLEEILENRHKVLVFSQFVDHLAVVRERLQERNIAFQYLDGATPLKEREKRVAAFQQGTGDVFLISLKAGGTGLNLTAADYVVHLDPWWNPAVEDQASDRAHRIGQQRPVTIYRLVTKDTVEERIVDLHRRKRDLADSLLEGTDAAARITAEELMHLLER